MSPGQVCAGDLHQPSGACNGDSGGPLVGQDKQGGHTGVGNIMEFFFSRIHLISPKGKKNSSSID